MPTPKLTTPENKIRLATAADFRFVQHLQNRFSNAVGFLPSVATENYIAMGGVMIALENDAPAGMLLGRDKFRWNIAMRPITQAAIEFDAQRRHIGLGLVDRVARDAREAGQVALQCCCREGLEANDFWKAAGFQEIARLDPGNSRGRSVICWRMPLLAHFLPPWFYKIPPRSGYRARKTKVA